MKIAALEITIEGAGVTLHGDMGRDALLKLFGPADDESISKSKSGGSRILVYGEVEFHFDQNDRLALVYSDSGEFVKLSVSFDRKFGWKT